MWDWYLDLLLKKERQLEQKYFLGQFFNLWVSSFTWDTNLALQFMHWWDRFEIQFLYFKCLSRLNLFRKSILQCSQLSLLLLWTPWKSDMCLLKFLLNWKGQCSLQLQNLLIYNHSLHRRFKVWKDFINISESPPPFASFKKEKHRVKKTPVFNEQSRTLIILWHILHSTLSGTPSCSLFEWGRRTFTVLALLRYPWTSLGTLLVLPVFNAIWLTADPPHKALIKLSSSFCSAFSLGTLPV